MSEERTQRKISYWLEVSDWDMEHGFKPKDGLPVKRPLQVKNVADKCPCATCGHETMEECDIAGCECCANACT